MRSQQKDMPAYGKAIAGMASRMCRAIPKSKETDN